MRTVSDLRSTQPGRRGFCHWYGWGQWSRRGRFWSRSEVQACFGASTAVSTFELLRLSLVCVMLVIPTRSSTPSRRSAVEAKTVTNVVASADHWNLDADAGCGIDGCTPALARVRNNRRAGLHVRSHACIACLRKHWIMCQPLGTRSYFVFVFLGRDSSNESVFVVRQRTKFPR